MAATLYGPDGQPIRKSDLTRDIAVPSAIGARQWHSQHPWVGMTPERLAVTLRAAEGGDAGAWYDVAEDLEERDPHYNALLGVRKRQVCQLEMTVLPADDSAAAQEHADLVNQWLARDDMADELFDMLDAVAKGTSVLEIDWDTSGGPWMPRRLVRRDPRWFTYSRDDGHTLKMRGDAGEEVDLPPCKFIVHQHRSKSGVPVRGGLARTACWPILFKVFDQKAWVAFIEVFGMPLRLGRYGASASAEDKATLLQAVRSIATDAAAIIPESMAIEFVESKVGGSGSHYEPFANWLDRSLSRLVLGQETTTQAISGGHAVSQEHMQLQQDVERADARAAAATLRRDLVRWMIDFNFGPQPAYPQLKIGRPDQVDAQLLIDALDRLLPRGLRVGQKFVRRALAIPEPDPDEEMFAAPADQGIAPDTKTPPAQARVTAAVHDHSLDPPDAIDRFLAGLASGGLEGGFTPLFSGIEAAFNAATGYADLKDRLTDLLRDMTPADLADVLARGQFAARVAGEVGASIEADV